MKISTRGEYGLRAMVALARSYGSGPNALASVAHDSAVPPAYLEQLLGMLRRAGLVASTRGAHGGYALAQPPEAIRIGDIYRVLEGPIAPMECVSEVEPDEQCPLIDGCATRVVWLKVRDNIIDALDSTTLADLTAPHAVRSSESVTADVDATSHVPA
ncbi:MAG TPA: Rrf2 family transcriptional regulator [Thermomicrobiales bacterium]|jgi:Rrf2 family protein|nr:Rrf2 family transcriptional regulator [Chloroflexota bacterium]HQX62715.1 Rrf2 family transcriptional regulator [Thermomicrobiales bacterium]HBY47431.1 Rrf2 family transcriptional regulator [Chloroflexota bacterium]HCG30320.1 Rrf2 family transcriptional regulator [Chloroflexota bacterium]HQZ88522.1 Rrf2 family transcriptional regulator [Thermomicrobiales bacterium]